MIQFLIAKRRPNYAQALSEKEKQLVDDRRVKHNVGRGLGTHTESPT
jgi:hypothetical protein